MLKAGDKVKLNKFGIRRIFDDWRLEHIANPNQVYTIVSVEPGFHIDDSPNADIVKVNCEVLNEFLITTLDFDKISD